MLDFMNMKTEKKNIKYNTPNCNYSKLTGRESH